mmetsp:Transcript_24776/g.62889  ORF Transcript_24776/g.62889 Transcript_24776/m.62889 type:complete len:261 (+) Transcript_24776:261-1043(+)
MLCRSMPPLPIFLFFFMVFCMVVCMSLNCSSSSITSCGWWPEPREMRRIREGTSILVSSSSASVIESIIVIHFLMRTPLSWKSRPDMPGNWFMMLPSGPILRTAWNCSRMSRSVHCPVVSRFIISGACFSRSTSACFIFSISPAMLPLPSMRLTKDLTSKSSKSSMCSPVPTCVMGAPVAATAERAPPPLAWPSSLVIMHEPTATLALKALAWSCAACPMLESITKTTSSGVTARLTCSISSKSALSCMCRPLVSTMMIS